MLVLPAVILMKEVFVSVWFLVSLWSQNKIDYRPGDSISIVCSNTPDDVIQIIDRYEYCMMCLGTLVSVNIRFCQIMVLCLMGKLYMH